MASATLLPLGLAAAEGGGGLTDPNLGLTVWTIVLFVLFALVLGKLGWKPLLAMIEERERRIVAAVQDAQQAQSQAQALLVEQRNVLREAGRQREEIVKRAFSDAAQLRADLSAQARAESEALIRRAKEQIEREKRLALQEIRAQVADLAVEAAGKIVTSSLSPAAQRKLVEEFLDSLPPDKG